MMKEAEDDPRIITECANESVIQMDVGRMELADACQHQQQAQENSQRNIQSAKKRPFSNAERQKRYREKKKIDKMNSRTTVDQSINQFSQSSDIQPQPQQPQPKHDVPIKKRQKNAERQKKFRKLLREKQQRQQLIENINSMLNNMPHTSSTHGEKNLCYTFSFDQAEDARKLLLNKQRQSRFRERNPADKMEITRKLEKDQQNVCNKPQRTYELDKYKRRLIRAIARLLFVDNKTESEVWEYLKKETGCDCELLWGRMKALTIKKLVRLLAAEDKLENITKVVQLSVNDWLLYDLVLVHENVDVIGRELPNDQEPKLLRELFQLVVEYDLENSIGEHLVKQWFEATLKYNNNGKRQCSAMLLQKRWYQLKELTRSNFYKFWFEYKGDAKKLEKAKSFKPSDLQMDVVKMYKEIVTKPFLSWEDLVKEKKVVLSKEFDQFRLARYKITSENEPDLQVVEPQIETIDLDEAIDPSNEPNNDDKDEENYCNIGIVKVESLSDDFDDISVLESMHIPLENSRFNNTNNDTTESSLFETNEEMMPKITSVTSVAFEPNVTTKVKELDLKEINDESRLQATADVSSILEQIVQNVIEKNFRYDGSDESSEPLALTNKDNENTRPNIRTASDKDVDTDAKENKKSGCSKDVSKDFGLLPTDLYILDNGIKCYGNNTNFVGRDYVTDAKSKTVSPNEVKQIDEKLILTPIVYTTKLDDMDVFCFIEYNHVADNRVLENAYCESKPFFTDAIETKEDSQSIKIQNEITEPIADDIDDEKEKHMILSSWYFSKPKVKSYNSIQLCKNPDFNKRLNRLTAAFYASERNRLQLKQCKPLTVDLHKAFEILLIDNTLDLSNVNKNSHVGEIHHEIPKCQTPPEITETNSENEDRNQEMYCEVLSDTQVERNKVINLPNIDQIRRANQGLLIAEVSPIVVSNTEHQINDVKPPIAVLKSDENYVNNNIPDIDETISTDLAKDINEPESASEIEYDIQNVDELLNTRNDCIDEQNVTSQVNHVENVTKCTEKVAKTCNNAKTSKVKQKSTYKKPMELSWFPKPVNLGDCLLADDTVERILCLCKDDYVPNLEKPVKTKRKRKSVQNKDAMTQKNPEKKEVSSSSVNVLNTAKKKQNKNIILKEKRKTKKKKRKSTTTTNLTTTLKNGCCWARIKINNFPRKYVGKHLCLINNCICCCKAELEQLMRDHTKKQESIVVSDDEPVGKVSVGVNTDYDKDFEDQYAANLSSFQDNHMFTPTPIITLPLGEIQKTFSNESGCQTLVPNLELLPRNINNVKLIANAKLKKSKLPIYLGKNKILLCSFKSTCDTKVAQRNKDMCVNQNESDAILPKGCQLVLLPNRELALSIDPGVELDAGQLSHVQMIISSVRNQINPTYNKREIPVARNIASMSDETVINLSDDEESDQPVVNINSATTNSKSTETNLDSIFKTTTHINKETACTDAQKVNVESSTTEGINDSSGATKKTILSDLMEMSGISADDINVAGINANISDPSLPKIQSVSSLSASLGLVSSASDLQKEYNNIFMRTSNELIFNNAVVRAALQRCPELNIVSSFPELKYAYNNKAQFFKMDIDTGIIVPINVCIKKNQRCLPKRDLSDSVIDLTEDNINDTEQSLNISDDRSDDRITEQEADISFVESSEIDKNCLDKQEKSTVKQIKMFKAIRPSILRYSGKNLLVRSIKEIDMTDNNIVVGSKYKVKKKHKRKQDLSATKQKRKSDLSEIRHKRKNKLHLKNTESGVESDDEPLSKKAKRIKDINEVYPDEIDKSKLKTQEISKSILSNVDSNLQPGPEPIVIDIGNQTSEENSLLIV